MAMKQDKQGGIGRWLAWVILAWLVAFVLLMLATRPAEAEESAPVASVGTESWLKADASWLHGVQQDPQVGAILMGYAERGRIGSALRVSVTGLPAKFTTSNPETFTSIAVAAEVHVAVMRMDGLSCGVGVGGEYGVPIAEQDGERPQTASAATGGALIQCWTYRGGPWGYIVGPWQQAFKGVGVTALMHMPIGAKTAVQLTVAFGEKRRLGEPNPDPVPLTPQSRIVVSMLRRF